MKTNPFGVKTIINAPTEYIHDGEVIDETHMVRVVIKGNGLQYKGVKAICFFISYIFTLIIVLNNIGDTLERLNETVHEPLSIALVIGILLFSIIISTVITKSFLKIFKDN